MAEIFEHLEHVPFWQEAGEGKPRDWEQVFAGYQSAVDWPASAFYRELMDAYPEAKVILTVRDAERWHESGLNTIFPNPARDPEGAVSPEMLAHRKMARTVIWDPIFDGRMLDREHAIDVFNRHNRTVREQVPAERLLVFDVKEGWEPLCTFLGVPVPSGEDFPRLNDTASFRERRESSQVPVGPTAEAREETQNR